MSANSAKPPQLVLRFALYAGAAVLITAGLALLIVRANARAEAESDVWDDAQYVADELGRDDLSGSAFVRAVGEDEEAQLDELVGRIASARRLDRVTLVSPMGTVTYSTDHSLAGRRLSGDAAAKTRAALRGRDSFGVSSGEGPRRVESYVPVRWLLGSQERSVGVLIADRDYAAVAREIRREFLYQAGTVLLALLVLYAAMLPILRRVTETLAAQNRRLRASEAEHRALMEQASDGILVCNPDGSLIQANESLAGMTGYSLHDLFGMNVRDLIDPADLERLPLRFGELLEGRTVLQERPIVRKDGTTFYGEFHGTRLADGRIHASLRDVTERKRLEAELRHSHLGEAEARLASSIAGDFDALLDTIDQHSQRLVGQLPNHEALHADLTEIREATTRGSSLVEQLRAFGGSREAEPEILDPNAFVGSMEPMIRLLMGKRVELVVELQATDRVEVDPRQLEKMLVDLVLNARDSMPRGGTVCVETANVDFEPKRGGRVHAGRFVMLAVSDTGESRGTRMPDEVDHNGDGELIGPGLAAVYSIVHRNGGSVGIDSEPERGTTVRVYLPSIDAAQRRAGLRAV